VHETENLAQGPKVYKMKWWRRASAIFFLAVAILSLAGFVWGPLSGQADPKQLGLFVSAILTVAGTCWTISTFESTVTLSRDEIAVRGFFGCKRLQFKEIRGRREYLVRGGGTAPSTRYLKLEPDDDQLSPLKFEKYYTFDDAFYQWFNKLPDLDALDKVKPKTSNFGLA
jgi:hypothetical protein